MKVLGIDTSTSCGSVGLIDDERSSPNISQLPVTHSERLLGAIELVLKRGPLCHWRSGWMGDLPRSGFLYRIENRGEHGEGVAFATRKPVAGVSTLDVLASQISPTPYLICPILDARKREVYTAFYRYEEENNLKRQSAYQAIKPEDLIKR